MKADRGLRRYVIGGVELSREEIVHKYLHLVKYVAGRISVNLPPNVEINDLINDGILGLIDAIEKYDDARGVKFETYAITRINGAILDALRSLDWVPRAVRQRARELERAHQELELENGRAPSEEEVAARLGLTKRELDMLIQRVRGTAVLSLEEFLRGAGGAGGSRRRALAARTHRYPAVLLRGPDAQGDQGRARRFGIAGLADPRPGGHPPADAAARAACRPRLPGRRPDDQAEIFEKAGSPGAGR
jgi:FliA/WhiG family RNA polymerase sigma factor